MGVRGRGTMYCNAILWVLRGHGMMYCKYKKHSLKKQKPYFCNAKTYFLHAKNHTFATQKGGFWKPLSIVLCFSMIDCVRLKGGEHTPKAIFGMGKTSGKLLFKHLSVYAITRQHSFGGVVMLHLLHICYKVGIGN